jgi:hypothetical protein
MASGHVNRIKKAEHMAAPTNAAKREESSCQSGAVHTWHIAVPTCATARPQLAKADTAFQAHPLVNRLNLALASDS